MIVGITGGLATGKSLVTQMLHARGAITFSADEAARAVLAPHGPVLDAIVQAFGAEMLLSNGGVDRARLAARIFADPQARERLNRITHPAILRLLQAQIEATRKDFPPETVVAVEVPLLYETNLSDWFERIVVVSASESTQIARLKARNGLTDAEARRRLASQWALHEKAARADVVLVNDGTSADLQMAVDRLWEQWTGCSPNRAKESPKKSPCVLPDIML
jgi:dephospho-CoA kinase